METVVFFGAAIPLVLAALYLWDHFIFAPKQKREAEAAPRITLSEAKAFWAAIEDASLPMAKATVEDRKPLNSKESRIGGAPLAIGEDSTWPRDEDNAPMAFIAQLNFAELPELEDFPTKGILQIFSSFAMIDDSHACERVIRWDPDPITDASLEIPSEIKKTTRDTRYFSEKARQIGLPLKFEHFMALGNPYNWPFAATSPMHENRLPENNEVDELLEGWECREEEISEGYGIHWVGGHPDFVQWDVRYDPDLQSLDRLLFHMGFDDDICIGDAGELNVMISRNDLLRRDFQKAFLTWDCG